MWASAIFFISPAANADSTNIVLHLCVVFTLGPKVFIQPLFCGIISCHFSCLNIIPLWTLSMQLSLAFKGVKTCSGNSWDVIHQNPPTHWEWSRESWPLDWWIYYWSENFIICHILCQGNQVLHSQGIVIACRMTTSWGPFAYPYQVEELEIWSPHCKMIPIWLSIINVYSQIGNMWQLVKTCKMNFLSPQVL